MPDAKVGDNVPVDTDSAERVATDDEIVNGDIVDHVTLLPLFVAVLRPVKSVVKVD